jgi:MFS transporter, OPA family, sugar phosphate sensor protein UhpC
VDMTKKWEGASCAQEADDSERVKAQYKYWRMRIFLGMYIGYIFYYITRKSFTFAMPAMINDLGFDKSDLGIIGSIFAITYGVSKFLSGVLADRTNPRFFMGIGLILTGVLNVLFGFSSYIVYFAIFWGLNGWFQAWGAPPCARLLTYWYSKTERGKWWGIWNSSHGIGGALAATLVAFCAHQWGWRYAMYIPGVICIGAGFYIMNRLRDTPRSLGLPTVEKFKNEVVAGDKKEEDETPLSVKEILFKYILNNRYLWLLALAYYFVYIIRQGVNDWSILYLMEAKGYSHLQASSSIWGFEMGGICGSLVAGWTSDKWFEGRRGPVNIIFCAAVIASLAAFWVAPAGLATLISMFAIGFFVFGPQMLIGMSAVELSNKKAAGTATGFAGFGAYLGAATAGYPLGKTAQVFGWYGFFLAVGLCGIVSILLLLPLWSTKQQPIASKSIAQEE